MSSRIQVGNARALSILEYGCEIWTRRKSMKKLLTPIKKKFYRRTAGCILFGHKIIQEFFLIAVESS